MLAHAAFGDLFVRSGRMRVGLVDALNGKIAALKGVAP
jgi:hypothetical protein